MRRMASRVSASNWKPKAAENRTARSIRSLSSPKRCGAEPMAPDHLLFQEVLLPTHEIYHLLGQGS